MRNRSFVLICALLGLLFTGAGGLYAYDKGQKDVIGQGVRVGGIDVSGMTASEARAELTTRFGREQARDIIVRKGKKRYTLNPARQAGSRFDVDAMVDAAVAESREGNIFSRTVRSLRDTKLNADIPAEVTYSEVALVRFVSAIERDLNRKPEDASIGFKPGGFDRVEGRDGITVMAAKLRADLAAKLTGTAAPGLVGVTVKKTEPKITREELAQKYPTLIMIDRENFKLRYYRDLKLQKTYTIALGAAGFDTPAGEYAITDKTVDPTWYVPNKEWAGDLAGQVIPGGAENNPLKARWLGFYNGAGIHGTADEGSLGSAASHGCVRMAIPDVKELYEEVPVNTPLYIG